VTERLARFGARLSRRRFLQRSAGAALAGYATMVGARSTAAAARAPTDTEGPVARRRCRLKCTVKSCTGCACGGNLFRCVGCGRDFIACYSGKACKNFCLQRHC